MANIFHVERTDNKITLGTTGTTIYVGSHTASKILALDASKNLEVVTIGSSLNYTRPTLNAIQDIRTTASPTFAGLHINSAEVVSTTLLTLESDISNNNEYNEILFKVVGGQNYGAIRSCVGVTGGDSYMSFFTTTDSGTLVRQVTIQHDGKVGFGTYNPGTLLEMVSTAPYVTLYNLTEEDTDGGGESRIIGEREDGAGTASAAGQIEISHDGSGANDQLGKYIVSVNTGAGLVQALEIGSDLLATFAGAITSAGLTVGADTDIEIALGRWRLGFVDGFPDMAVLSHYDHFDTLSAALIQTASGNTYVGCDAGNLLYFVSGATTYARFWVDGTQKMFSLSTSTLGFGGTFGSDRIEITHAAGDILTIESDYGNVTIDLSGKMTVGSFGTPTDVTNTRQYGFEIHYSGNDYDVTGIRSRAQLITTDTTATAQGALIQAANNDNIDAGVLNGALIEAIGKATTNAATISMMRGCLVNTEWSAKDTVTDLRILHVRTHTRDAATEGYVSGTGYGLYIENEAVGGNGQALDAGIYFKGTNLSAGNKAFTYGVDFSGATYGTTEIKLKDGGTIGSSGASLNITSGHIGVGAASHSDQGIRYIGNLTLTDNLEKFGVISTIKGQKTTEAFTNSAIGVLGRITLEEGNTQNWTHALYGMIGVEGATRVAVDSNGIIANAVSLLARAEVWGATVTNNKSLYIESPAIIAPGSIVNNYGIYVGNISVGTTLNYAIYTNAGLVRLGDDVDVTGNANVTGVYKVDTVQVVGNRVIDARCDDAINSGDATTDGVIDSLRDAMITHGLIAAA